MGEIYLSTAPKMLQFVIDVTAGTISHLNNNIFNANYNKPEKNSMLTPTFMQKTAISLSFLIRLRQAMNSSY